MTRCNEQVVKSLDDAEAATWQALATELAAELGSLLLSGGWLVTTAESCTGGLIASAITEVAGSSAWFERAVVTYSNAAKQSMLGVDEAILHEHGAVSEACVKAMARGALERTDAHVAIAVSGIAGPDGATPGKPVGTVWIGWVLATKNTVEAERFVFRGNRRDVREQAVCQALRGTILRISDTGS